MEAPRATAAAEAFDAPPLLRVDGLSKRFGGIVALEGYQVRLFEGDLVGLIGPNGAGKTTVFNLLSGVMRPTAGRIRFAGRDVTGQRPDRRAFLGIARTFQNIRLFPALSVVDNVRVALHRRLGCGLWPTLLHTRSFRNSEREIAARADRLLSLLDLADAALEPAGVLPYGLQRRLEIARALAASPRLLLLDEPTAGLNPSETEALAALLRRIHAEFGLTLLVVEHDMHLIMGLCHRIQVLDRGRVLMEGTPEAVRTDPRVVEAYLGTPKARRDRAAAR